ncbi:hypothetical protein [Pyxidicoccus sp. MSG2]|uniref:hypothetical protein n=1 Tax=Pyxidicoccus sp. MSG2 TaxID=2996790 RepID=UPI002270BB13|nr:hypothetical protein [Pyxidicoccus sp. MSG2]MCY1021975.1 hypothetical protein [Pyxidicoccus sp. MSG2]
MKALALRFALAVLLVAMPAQAAAPAMKALMDHMSRGARASRVGDWVTYRMDGGGARVHYWRMAVVGQEKDRYGRDAVWMEVEFGTHPAMRAPLGQMKMLVALGESNDPRRHAITRLIASAGYGKPQEYSQEALEAELKKNEQAPAPDEAARAKAAPEPALTAAYRPVVRSGKEARLMTHAGTVTAVPVEVVMRSTVIKRMWMSREIPVINLAKIEIPGIGQSMEVAEYGVDAKSRIRMPQPNEPQIHLEYAEEKFANLPWLQEDEEESP